jgi:hypothetical protein
VITDKKEFYVAVKCDLLFEMHRDIFELNGNEVTDNFGYYITRNFIVYGGHLVLRE